MTFSFGNHLWQSSLFAAAAGLLTLALRKNRAGVRYWLWLTASCKFLLPFSWLIAMGRHIPWRTAPAAGGSVGLVFAGQSGAALPIRMAAPLTTSHLDLQPLLVTLWLCGAALVILFWYARWRRLEATLQRATPSPVPAPIPVMTAPGVLEPGVFGILRPVLLLPEGITGRLTPQELQAIVAHELCHVRRRDNLAAALHMLVEAIFWFHPLVWWLGARLVEERERACDEEVLRSRTEPQTYAAGILKVCRFYVESPLDCAAGAAGANLKQRIEAIMAHRTAERLGMAKKLFLAAAGAAAIAVPIAAGMMDAPRLRAQSPQTERLAFEVASIKENQSEGFRRSGAQFLPGGRLVVRNLPLAFIIDTAYDVPVQSDRVTGGPDWIRQTKYDIDAAAAKGAVADGTPAKVLNEKVRLMLQTLLAERFHMKVRSSVVDLPVYVVSVAKDGPKLQKAAVAEKDCAEYSAGATAPAACHGFQGGQGQGLHGQAVSLSDLVSGVARFADRPVIDKTGLHGLFNIQTEGWAPMRPRAPRPPGQEPSAEDLAFADPARPTIFQIFDRLGLKLESSRGPVETYVIESVDRPTEN